MDEFVKFKRCLEFIGIGEIDFADPKYTRHFKQTLRRNILKKSNVKRFYNMFGKINKEGKVYISSELGKCIKEEWYGIGELLECVDEVGSVFKVVEDGIVNAYLKIDDDDKVELAEKELGNRLVSVDCVKYFNFNDKGKLVSDDYNNYISVLKYDKYLQDRIKYDDFYHRFVYENRFMTEGDVTEIWGYISRVYDLRNINYLNKLVREENNHMVRHFNSLRDMVTEDIDEFEYEKDEIGEDISYIDNFFEKVCGKVPQTNEERVYQRELARMIFYGIVARVFSDNPNGVKFDYVPIFESSQGKGKSTLVSRLNILPSTYDVVDAFDGKDAMLHLNGKCFMEIAELQAMNKAKDNETIKKFVTKSTDTFRLPYGRSDVTYVRTCIFIGTTNDASFLTDITGNRRYLPINLDTMSYDMVTCDYATDYIKKCWQEAYLLWTQHKIYLKIPNECWEIVNKYTEFYTVDDPVEGAIHEYVTNYDSEKRTREDAVCGVEIFTHCMNGLRHNYGKNDARAIAFYMKNMPGWKKYEGKLRFGDYGLQRCWVKEDFKEENVN
jgi:hypothetical protein